MVNQQFTTEVFDSEISVVCLDTVGCFSPFLETFFEQKKVQLVVADCSNPESYLSACETAYKIVLCLSPLSEFKKIDEIINKISIHQQKINIIIPLISGWEQQMEGEVPFARDLQHAQEELILYCNEFLPHSSFVFGQDVLLPPGTACVFDLLLQNIQHGVVLSPTSTTTLVTLPSFCRSATQEILRPEPGSAVISGRTKPLLGFLQQAARFYESYYFTTVDLQTVVVEEKATIPFSVRTTVVYEVPEEIVNWYTRQLPSPQEKPFFNPAEDWLFKVPEKPVSFEHTSNEMQEFLGTVEHTLSFESLNSEPFLEASPEPVFTSQEMTPPAPFEGVKNNEPFSSEKTEFNVSSEIKKIFSQSRLEEKVERTNELVKKEKKIQKKSKKRTALFYGGMAFTGMGLGILLLMVIFVTSVFFLKKSLLSVLVLLTQQREVSDGDWVRLDRYQRILSAQTFGYSSLVELPQIEEATHLVSAEKKLKEIKNSLKNSESAQKQLVMAALSNGGDIASITQNAASQSLTTYESITQLQNDLSQVSFPNPDAVNSVEKIYQERLAELKKNVSIQQQFQPVLANLLGQNERRTYAVVLQNNQELRPTGGFVEAVAVLTFEKGALVSKNIYTSYELDTKVPGEVLAPIDLAKATGEKLFWFHDSNWDPDFPQSADRMKWFIEKSLNTSLDGVITMDLYSLQNLLSVTGPLELPEFNEVLTEKNLMERMEFHSEVVLVDSGKTQDYRKLVLNRLFEKLTALPEDKAVAFIGALQKSFTDQSILAYFARPPEQQVLQTIGWTGGLLSPACPNQFSNTACQVDGFMQVEANVGVNKANYYLKRSVEHLIKLSPTEAQHTRTVTFENTAQSTAWPKGNYKNYLRFYLPDTAKNVSLSVDGAALPVQQLTKSTVRGFQVWGFLVEVPIKTTKQVSLVYSTPLSVGADKKPFSYIFFNHEQPGNGDYPFLVRVQPSKDLHAQVIAPQATLGLDGITFNKDSDETGLYGIQFEQAN